ncbi:MAG TPA: formate dehydrogenase accessory protein FdhE [Methylomirabilota bacterium]
MEAWAGWAPPRPLGLALTSQACWASWQAGVPLVSQAARALRAEDVEGLAGDAMESLARLDASLGPSLHRLAEAWDDGRVTPAALLPSAGRIGTAALEQVSGLATDLVAFLAVAALRPALQAMFEPVRGHLADGAWPLGVCPFCGSPPSFTDVIEDGRRRLSCHLCGGAWAFARLRCPFCGADGAQHVARFTPDEAREEGYLISACRACRAYLKELDRRVRWNGGPALVEDWGSPHFDLIARRHGYWRPEGSVVLRAGGEPEAPRGSPSGSV